MNKKLTIVFLALFALLATVGVVMIVNNGTPYLNCLQWLSDLDYVDGHLYAMENIEQYTNAYFGGIIMLFCGIEGCVLTAIFAALQKIKHSSTSEQRA